jgi:leucyl aminopeptidase
MLNSVVDGDISSIAADAMVAGLFEGDKITAGVILRVNKALDGEIDRLISSGEFKAKHSEISIIHTLGKLPVRLVVILGLGKQREFNADKLRSAVAEVCRLLRKLNCQRITMTSIGSGFKGITIADSTKLIAEGSILGLYDFDKYKKPEYKAIDEITVVTEDASKLSELRAAIIEGVTIAESTNIARDMVNEPANCMTPGHMVEVAEKIAEKYNLQLKVLNVTDMQSLGMGALLGVAKGSIEPPKLIILHYHGDESSSETIGFIGKGVTFDSGGISLKPSKGMGEMKGDMSGAAAVLAAVNGIAGLQLKINVTAIVPAVENLPSGTAYRPADILKSMSGKTIEVISTDAEGRLILADALCYALKMKLNPLIDLATLTGACLVALGTEYAGAFSNNKKLMTDLIQSSDIAGEHLWQLPLAQEYKELNKSQIADIKNVGGKYAGAITAALFLAEFTDNKPWVHMDIAGVASSEREKGYVVKGATGFGVRTLIEFASLSSKEGGKYEN